MDRNDSPCSFHQFFNQNPVFTMDEQLQDGMTSPKSFAIKIYQKHHSELLLFTRGKTQQILDDKEVLQDFYVKLMKNCKVISPKYNEYGVPYLKRIIINQCNDRFKNNNRKKEALIDLKKQLSEEIDGSSYHSSAIYERYFDLFEKHLTPLEHQLLSQSIQGYSHREIANNFGLTISHVGVLLFRTRNKVALLLKGN